MIDSSRQHIRPHHHTRPATGRRIVHGTMLIGCKVPDLNGIAGPFAVHQGAPRKRLTERTGEHLRVESEDLSSKSHQLSMTLLQIGRAHVLTPVTNAHLVCRLLLEKKKKYIRDNRL